VRRGDEVHLVGCRVDRIEESVTDAAHDRSKESDRRGQAGASKPAQGDGTEEEQAGRTTCLSCLR
jgi:hypothetical protein